MIFFFICSLILFFFQLPFFPEMAIRANDFGIVTDFFDGSKKYTGKDCFPEYVKEAYKYSFGQPGIYDFKL